MNNTAIVKSIFAAGVMIVCGLVLSSFIVSGSWAALIHERAYHCDDGFNGFFGAFLGFMDSLESCRQYDELSEGWTWDRIETIREYHVAAFWVIALCPLIYMLYSYVRAPFKTKNVVEQVASSDR